MVATTSSKVLYRVVENPTWILLALAAMGLAVTGWSLSNVVVQATRTAAIQNAMLISESLSAFRSLYTTEIVAKLDGEGIHPSHENAGRAGMIPLPISLSLQFGKAIGSKHIESKTQIYSPYPFPWKEEEGGLRDAFAREAWTQLSIAPDEPVMRFDQRDGRAILRYASSDLMNAQCVECHNSYPGTPKSDWKPGDVRGVVEVSLPIEPAAAPT